uniref:Uncharacterized protein n=1 Tax=Zea mays TaxID=4577 RepID=B7ZZA3_MAIZE|nr:unknown [Zea mays]
MQQKKLCIRACVRATVLPNQKFLHPICLPIQSIKRGLSSNCSSSQSQEASPAAIHYTSAHRRGAKPSRLFCRSYTTWKFCCWKLPMMDMPVRGVPRTARHMMPSGSSRTK